MFILWLIRNHAYKEKRLEQWKASVIEISVTYDEKLRRKIIEIKLFIRQSRSEEKDHSDYQTVHNLETPDSSVTAFTGPFSQTESSPVELLDKHRQVELSS